MENVASMIDFPYTFEEWFENMGFVVISPSQLNGSLDLKYVRTVWYYTQDMNDHYSNDYETNATGVTAGADSADAAEEAPKGE